MRSQAGLLPESYSAGRILPNPMSLLPFRTVLVTGASSGIGSEIAKNYAEQGVTLILGGRNKPRLEAVGTHCEAKGARVIHWPGDLGDIASALEMLAKLDDSHAIDLAIFNAGIGDSRETEAVTEHPEITARLADVNYRAPAALAALIAERMTQRKSGAICLVGSAAAWTPLAMAPGYAASKAALHVYAHALDAAVRPHNVFVTLAIPGFIDTPMSRRLDCKQPFRMSAEKAAVLIAHAIEAKKREIVLPWQFRLLRMSLALLPNALTRAFLARMPFAARPYDADG